jgi:antitoxin component YwqK of YwqJK toxin-antitoxin module
MALLRPIVLISGVMIFAACGASKLIVSVTEQDATGTSVLSYAEQVQNDKLTGEVRLTPNGDTISITPLLNGVLHGEVVSFHPNGLRKESVTFADGKATGPFKAYDLEGVLVFEGILKDGRKHGLWKYWYDETQVKQQCQYQNDVLTGKCTYWYIDGNLQREETYSDGKLVASQEH